VRELLTRLREWERTGLPVALATVVAVRGSAPRQPGATMAVTAEGEVIGSVSGGCVEAAVYDTAMRVLQGAPATVESYGISDDDAFAVGLTCGGELDVLIRAVSLGDWSDALSSLSLGEPVAFASLAGGASPPGRTLVVWPHRVDGTLGNDGLDAAVTADVRGLLAQGMTGVRHYGPRGQRRQDAVTVFVQSFAPPPRLLVFGAIDFAGALARLGSYLGYRVTVCDARPVFATPARFPDAAEVVCEQPAAYLARTTVEESTVICVLTHDPKFDVPVLEVALRSPAAYIGAMGSRRTHADRVRRLRAAGVTDAELARLAAPIGLDIGARTPEETAVAIAAEIIQQRWGGTGHPLTGTAGPIHRSQGAPVRV
jgi:xanthine dehydrogenase accessory factor